MLVQVSGIGNSTFNVIHRLALLLFYFNTLYNHETRLLPQQNIISTRVFINEYENKLTKPSGKLLLTSSL